MLDACPRFGCWQRRFNFILALPSIWAPPSFTALTLTTANHRGGIFDMVAAGSITVAVRVRPPTSWEATRLPQTTYDNFIRTDGALSMSPAKAATNNAPLRDVIQVIDDRVLTFDPDEKDPSRAFVERGFLPPGTKRYKDRRFIFDKVFDHQARQEGVYCGTAKPLLTNLLEGYNATIFAYGATGCGKTHTISGTDTDPGIIYLTMADLFQRIEDRREEYIIDVSIRDLLAEPGTPTPRGGLQIREDKTVKVIGLQELRPTSADEVKSIVLLGNSRRTQSPTHANETSSRSHAVLQVHVAQAPRTANITEQRTMGTLSIIDLAGSERAAATTNMGQRMVEGANINKSLLALGNCINALCESGGAIRHVPYRNSKLTRLLKFSLGGNCKTVMIVCIAPTSLHFDDTQNTLVYAERATRIKTKVITRNVVNVDRHVGQYVEAINRLNLEVAELKQKVAGKRDTEAEREKRRRQEAAAEVARSKNDMQQKAEQMQPSIVDGASCAGKIAVAEAKLKVIRTRLAQLDTEASSSSTFPADLETERQLLKALAGPEEDVVKAQSVLNARVQRSSNSDAMFDATLRAVSERRSDKLDEYAVDNVKLDARWRKAEMERAKAEAGKEVLKEAVTSQAEALVNLVGLVSRCTVMLGDASRILATAAGEGRDGMEATVKALSSSLGNVAESNDEAFKALLGHSIASYAAGAAPSSLNTFKGYPSALGMGRSASGPTVSQPGKPRLSRPAPSSPLRKSHKSPRKSLRSSLAPSSAPYRRKKKGVQWRDEAGQGNIDDGGLGAVAPVITVSTPDLAETSSAPALEPSFAYKRPTSAAGSESEWEDEKTEDSFNVSFSQNASHDVSVSAAAAGAVRKRPRASRLDPSFLKSKSRSSNLESLAENDEDIATRPLGDRNMNRIPSPDGSSSSSSTMDALHIPKGRERQHGSPAKRAPMTPKVVGMSKGARRRDRTRRRSSMIPQLSPFLNKRERSPAKRVKRISLLSASSNKLTAAEMSFSGIGKGVGRPTWK
ncbi:P-loop containing nucleoside triphosphate hydrolase protein [Fomitopsis serialis]|uniref:P-loop containing nucleoside triphosphate hydrolase protein n=1 Tax=Fomitopsis serialis TaxID=139415 RepID=UPI0020087C9E|nr:P-loop containing nucleoside triphosphate hydrolase protein [Neoantrodia serialis]KAH9938616.1 P-loop containing nucleoside triphosphate hydrolase protein [Neoantrodia serialis]